MQRQTHTTEKPDINLTSQWELVCKTIFDQLRQEQDEPKQDFLDFLDEIENVVRKTSTEHPESYKVLLKYLDRLIFILKHDSLKSSIPHIQKMMQIVLTLRQKAELKNANINSVVSFTPIQNLPSSQQGTGPNILGGVLPFDFFVHGLAPYLTKRTLQSLCCTSRFFYLPPMMTLYPPMALAIKEKKITPQFCANDYLSLTLDENGDVYISGSGSDRNYQMFGLKSGNQTLQKLKLPGDQKAKYIAMGIEHGMIILEDGTLWACGCGRYGNLGLGNTVDHIELQQVILPPERKARSASLGCNFSIVLLDNNTAWTCGLNNNGELGTDAEDRTKLQQVMLPKPVITISAGYSHSMAILNDGTVWVWGNNQCGALGLGNRNKKETLPKKVVLPLSAKFVAAGFHCSTVILENGSFWVSGAHTYGKLGLGDDKDNVNTFTLIQLPHGVKAAALGTDHTNLLLEDGSVWTSGNNAYQFEPLTVWDEDLINKRYRTTTFVQVDYLSPAIAIYAGTYCSAVVLANGGICACGQNQYSQLGITQQERDVMKFQPVPIPVANLQSTNTETSQESPVAKPM